MALRAPSTKIYGCAEDALTLKVLNERCDSVTGTNGTERKERVIFYRPGFGRGPSEATFGEFDGIVIEKNHVFLIESKWSERPTRTTEIRLEKHQIERHSVMRWYISHWHGENTWGEFYNKLADVFLKDNPGHKMPAEKTKLSKILKFSLDEIYKTAGEGCDITDILLLLHPKGTITPKFNNHGDFKPIPMEYSTEDESGFFELLPRSIQ